jgi:acid phosphatase
MCAAHSRRPLAFVLTTGDNFYRPDGVATRDNWERPEACLRRAGIPWRPAWGNHDLGGSATAEVLGAPARWYMFRRGPLRVVVLDANDPGNRDQLAFLRRTLRSAREPLRVVALHQPVHTAGVHPPGGTQRRLWEPEFRRGGVALVLQGHNHAYERIMVGGVVYVTTGGGGAPVYPCLRPAPGLRACVPVHHFLTVDVSAAGARVRSVRARGGLIEDVWVPARAPRP